MTSILALDTSSEACSAALWSEGEIIEEFEVIPRRQAAMILPMIEKVLHAGGVSTKALDAVAFGRGPGSFTGLRIAAGVTQGIAFGAGIPVVPVSTLAALALQAFQRSGHHHVIASLDAKIGEVYWGCFHVDGDEVQSLHDERLSLPERVVFVHPESSEQSWYGAGTGWRLYTGELARLRETLTGCDENLLPRAGDVARLAVNLYRRGEVVAADDAAPVYLRDKVAERANGL